VNSTQIAQDGYAGHVLSVERQNASSLLAEPCGAFWGRYLAMQMVMLPVVRCGNLSQQTCHHLNDVRDRHVTNFILGANVGGIPSLPP
jgi:hypothetical protein